MGMTHEGNLHLDVPRDALPKISEGLAALPDEYRELDWTAGVDQIESLADLLDLLAWSEGVEPEDPSETETRETRDGWVVDAKFCDDTSGLVMDVRAVLARAGVTGLIEETIHAVEYRNILDNGAVTSCGGTP